MAPHAVGVESETAFEEVRSSPYASRPMPMRHRSSMLSPLSPSAELALESADKDDMYDLIGVGFGPSNLALAVALHDAMEHRTPIGATPSPPPRVLFLERQTGFGWHRGMLLPGAKMQISFAKDMATMRNPRSHFTFLNYLHEKGRLASFLNLSTFLPHRSEYEDYMHWCADHFADIVEYDQEVASITPAVHDASAADMVDSFTVKARNATSGATRTLKARKVVIAAGGQGSIPKPLKVNDPRVIHSSAYLKDIGSILPDKHKDYTVAIVGGGQSAAEIFNDLHSRYPAAKTRMILRGAALKPSDDSPFVNEIFDPERVDTFFGDSQDARVAAIADDKATNYGVVRPELLEKLYEMTYMQKVGNLDPRTWQHQILSHRSAAGISTSEDRMTLLLKETMGHNETDREEKLQVDAVIVAVGYSRNAYEYILAPMDHLRPEGSGWNVRRDYSVDLDRKKVAKQCGIYLSGCNEATHGLSDSLLSILATRGGEMVDTIFGGF